MKVQGIDRSTLPWKAPFQPYTAWFGCIGSAVLVLAAGFSVFLKGNWSTSNFIASYIGIPIFLVPIALWKLLKRTKVRLPFLQHDVLLTPAIVRESRLYRLVVGSVGEDARRLFRIWNKSKRWTASSGLACIASRWVTNASTAYFSMNENSLQPTYVYNIHERGFSVYLECFGQNAGAVVRKTSTS